ncbi:MAG: hypothetical protein RIM80_10215, partial [Alphaproteobacteria bacterium]
LLAKTDAIRRKFGVDRAGESLFPRRPKRMRRRTYERLIDEDFAIEEAFERAMLARFGEYIG